jgi:cytidine deaminase
MSYSHLRELVTGDGCRGPSRMAFLLAVEDARMEPPESIPVDGMEAAEVEVLAAAAEATRRAFDPERWGGAHMVGAALRADGDVFTGVSLPASVGRASMCAEPVALGRAIEAGARELETVVAVRHPLPGEDREFEVTPPCGACRELLSDYGREATVLVPGDTGLERRTLAALLPDRTW